MRKLHDGKLWAVGIAILIYFFLLAGGGLRAGFMGDDLMNIAFLHGYGRVSLGVMLAQALSIFTPEYRPVGGLYYRTLFAIFGFHPTPFRIAFFTLLALNILLAGLWYRRLTHSRMTIAAATLLFSFHPALAELYYDNATIYDVLCVSFVLLLLARYVHVRQNGRFLANHNLLLILALYGAALGSKEMALTVPAVLVLYEVSFHPGLRHLRARLFPILLLGVMTAVCMAVKILIPNQMSINPGYAPHYQIGFIGTSYLHYYRLLMLNDNLSAIVLAVGLIVVLFTAIALRNRPMLLGFLFANLTLFPVCTIVPRAGFVWYMPLLGYALYGGELISIASRRIIASLEPRVGTDAARLRFRNLAQAILFGTLVAGAYAIQSRYARNLGEPFFPEQQKLKSMLAAGQAAAPTLPHGSRILVERDPYPAVWWWPLFLFRLGYQDPTLWIDRVSQMGDAYDPSDVSLYALRLRWDGIGYRVRAQPQASEPAVTFAVAPEQVRRGQTARLQFPAGMEGCEIDVAYRMPEDELMRGGIWNRWTQLDAAGMGTARVTVDAERGLVVIDRVRACNRAWLPAQAFFFVEP